MTPPPSDRLLPALLLALTAVTGFVDAVSYLALGRVFTANMTGNVVFLGFALANVPGLSIGRSGAALGAFVIGAILGGRLAARMGQGSRHRWISAGFGIEAGLLLAAAAVAVGAGDDLTTTVLTLTITGMAADSTLAKGMNPGWTRRAASVAAMFTGAAAGAWLLRHSVALPVAIAGAISAACALALLVAGQPRATPG